MFAIEIQFEVQLDYGHIFTFHFTLPRNFVFASVTLPLHSTYVSIFIFIRVMTTMSNQ